MSEKTRNFLLKLGEDPETADRYRTDPKAVMDKHGVPEDHQKLLLDGDVEGLRKAADLEDAHVNFIIT